MSYPEDNDKTRTFDIISQGSEVANYTVRKIIGQGGMGVVYLAWDNDLQRNVAIKFLLPSLVEEKEYVDRFRNEALAVAKLSHPQIVSIFHVGSHNETPFFVMEYVDGVSLRDAIGKKPMPIEEIVDISTLLCDALGHAHENKIVHADLKPENIIISKSKSLKILDFGLAAFVETATLETRRKIEGTIHYMSPEQISGYELAPSSDLFSLGVLIYEMLTGRRPFEGDSPAKVIYSILHEDPRLPRELRPDVPDWIESLVISLLSKSEKARPASMNEVTKLFVAPTSRTELHVPAPRRLRVKTVTVLDLLNMSGDRSWDYFCVGFTEDIVREVSRRTDLVVSSMPSESYARDIREVFKRCRSDYVVNGTLMKWKEEIKLSLSLYRGEDIKLCFGEQYSGETESVFEVLSRAAKDLSRAVARESNSNVMNVSSSPGVDATAYDFYLKGRSYYQSNKPELLDVAEQMFVKALQLDPGFADAHTGLSDVYSTQYLSFYDRSLDKLELAKKEAESALSKDPVLPDAHRSLGRYYMSVGDLSAAEEALLRAIEMSPKYSIGYRTIAWLKEMQGDHESALHWAKRALELAPTDLETLLLISLIYIDSGSFNLAISTLARIIELGPDYGRAYYYLGMVYTKLGVIELALENYEKAVLFQGDPNVYVDCGYALLIAGRHEDADLKFRESIERGLLPYIAHYYLGFISFVRGDESGARNNLNGAVEHSLRDLGVDPRNEYAKCYTALAYALLGKGQEGRDLLGELEDRIEEIDGDIVINIARFYALLGETSFAEKYKLKAMSKHAGPTEKEVILDPHFSFRKSSRSI